MRGGGGDYRHKVLDYLIKTTGIDPIKRFFPNKLRNYLARSHL